MLFYNLPGVLTPGLINCSKLALAKFGFMPYIKVWIHLVWSTKNRLPFLTDKIRQSVFEHIKQNAKTKGIYLDCVNGYKDHIHCLISISNDQTISKILQLIKGESSYWINKQKQCSEKFEWQEEYFAVSVSHSQINKVRAYIYNQENHHQKKTFQQEYDNFISSYEFSEASRVEKKTIQVTEFFPY